MEVIVSAELDTVSSVDNTEKTVRIGNNANSNEMELTVSEEVKTVSSVDTGKTVGSERDANSDGMEAVASTEVDTISSVVNAAKVVGSDKVAEIDASSSYEQKVDIPLTGSRRAIKVTPHGKKEVKLQLDSSRDNNITSNVEDTEMIVQQKAQEECSVSSNPRGQVVGKKLPRDVTASGSLETQPQSTYVQDSLCKSSDTVPVKGTRGRKPRKSQPAMRPKIAYDSDNAAIDTDRKQNRCEGKKNAGLGVAYEHSYNVKSQSSVKVLLKTPLSGPLKSSTHEKHLLLKQSEGKKNAGLGVAYEHSYNVKSQSSVKILLKTPLSGPLKSSTPEKHLLLKQNVQDESGASQPEEADELPDHKNVEDSRTPDGNDNAMQNLHDGTQIMVDTDGPSVGSFGIAEVSITASESGHDAEKHERGKKPDRTIRTTKRGRKPKCKDKTPEIFRCTYCLKLFSCKSSFKIHSRTHRIDQKFECSICQKAFHIKSDLKRHSLTHTGERPFKCFCGKGFTCNSSLVKHQRTNHLDGKQYKCPSCDKGFYVESDLNRHLMTHTGQRPFKCAYCDKGFTCKSSQKQHEKFHVIGCPYKCAYCPKAFHQESDLIRHEFVHTGNCPFKCSICDKAFTCKSSFTYHVKKHGAEGFDVLKMLNVGGSVKKPRSSKLNKAKGNSKSASTADPSMSGTTVVIEDHIYSSSGTPVITKDHIYSSSGTHAVTEDHVYSSYPQSDDSREMQLDKSEAVQRIVPRTPSAHGLSSTQCESFAQSPATSPSPVLLLNSDMLPIKRLIVGYMELVTESGAENQRILICKSCNSSFQSKADFAQHIVGNKCVATSTYT